MSASSSLLPMTIPQPPMNVSTGLGIGVSVVIPSFSRPDNIPQMLSSLLLAIADYSSVHDDGSLRAAGSWRAASRRGATATPQRMSSSRCTAGWRTSAARCWSVSSE